MVLTSTVVGGIITAIFARKLRAAEARKTSAEAEKTSAETDILVEDANLRRVRTMTETIQDLLEKAQKQTTEILELSDKLRVLTEERGRDLQTMHGQLAIIQYQKDELTGLYTKIATLAEEHRQCQEQIMQARIDITGLRSEVAELQRKLSGFR